MEPSDGPELTEANQSPTEVQPDRLDYLEARVRMLEERMPTTQLVDRRFLHRAFAVLGHYLVAGLIICAVALAALLPIALLGFGISSFTRPSGETAIPEGPPLSNVASLPVDASGEGTIQGAPTGAATMDDNGGSFVLVLDPSPAGLPARTTLDVAFDHSTKVYSGTRASGDPLAAMNPEGGHSDADPTAAGTVVVRFHIKDGRVFADRLDLSNEFPPGGEP
jgi:hypothetical protein